MAKIAGRGNPPLIDFGPDSRLLFPQPHRPTATTRHPLRPAALVVPYVRHSNPGHGARTNAAATCKFLDSFLPSHRDSSLPTPRN